MKKLPSIFKNNSDKFISNNRSVYYVDNAMKYDDIIKILDSIFLGFGLPQDISVFIKTKNNCFNTRLKFMGNDCIYTIDDEKIFIKDIIFIEKKDTN